MLKKLNWRIVALIAFVIAAGGFMYWQWSEMQQMKEQAAQFEKMFEEEKKPIAENGLPPAAPGNKWVPHGDHFHEVPIDAPDVWQGEPHEPVAQPAPKKHTGPPNLPRGTAQDQPGESTSPTSRRTRTLEREMDTAIPG